MAQAPQQGVTPGSQQPQRYAFAMNPFPDERFSRCPICKEATAELLTALVMHIAQGVPFSLRYPCRYCGTCDLLIAHQVEVEAAIEHGIGSQALIEPNYRVLGTIDLADWERSRAEGYTVPQLLARLHPFRQVMELVKAEAPGEEATPASDKDAAPAASWKKSMSVPARMRPIFDEVTRVTDTFCAEHLTEEYAELCRALAAALCRKRTSPLVQGKLDTWACGIVYTIGSVNFLFDKSQDPHMRATDLCKHFGISQSTGSARSKVIRDALKIDVYDPHWCLPSKLDQNPFVWLIEVDGFPMDARHAPRAVQEMALRRGLIPYIPGTR